MMDEKDLPVGLRKPWTTQWSKEEGRDCTDTVSAFFALRFQTMNSPESTWTTWWSSILVAGVMRPANAIQALVPDRSASSSVISASARAACSPFSRGALDNIFLSEPALTLKEEWGRRAVSCS